MNNAKIEENNRLGKARDHFKSLKKKEREREKKSKLNPKTSKRKEIIKTEAETNGIENRKIIKKIKEGSSPLA